MGHPLGLLTLSALWTNGRTLVRWSRLGPVLGALVPLLGLTAPALVLWGVLQAFQEEQAARARGDWVSEETAQLIDDAHARMDLGDVAGALELYRKAQQEAPDSTTTNLFVASALGTSGRWEEALPYAAKATSLAPRDGVVMGLHAEVLARLERTEEAREVVARLEAWSPADADAATWVASACSSLGDWTCLLRVAEAGLAFQPDHGGLRYWKLEALIGQRRWEESEALAKAMEESPGTPEVTVLKRLIRAHRNPREEMVAVTDEWMQFSANPVNMERLHDVVEEAGELDDARGIVLEFLNRPETPGDAWWAAPVWFEEEEWDEVLDRCLEHRPEVAATFLRLGTLDPVTDAERQLRLADRARRLEHPSAAWLDVVYFRSRSRLEPLSLVLADLETHVRLHPEHLPCRFWFVATARQHDGTVGRAALEDLAGEAGDDSALRAALEVLRLESMLADGGDPKQIRRKLEAVGTNLGPYLDQRYVQVLNAELTYHLGLMPSLARQLDALMAASEDGDSAVVLVLRWSSQLAASRPLTYTEDVAAWLERNGDAARRSSSASAQGILLAEGRVDAAWATRAMGHRSTATPRLVAVLKQAAAGGPGGLDPDLLGELRAIAERPPEEGMAPRLAKTILKRRGE